MEYSQTWKQLIPLKSLDLILSKLRNYLPDSKLIFKAFSLCDYNNLKVVFIGMDPYNIPGVATGLLFGNSASTPEDKLSPSLNIIKEAVIDYTVPHNSIIFDNTLESWESQGVLLLNSALTVEPYKAGSHFLLWLPFMKEFLKRLGESSPGMVYVLFGKQAQMLEHSIVNGIILKEYHPAYYARQHERMPGRVFIEVNKLLKSKYNETIQWFQEINN